MAWVATLLSIALCYVASLAVADSEKSSVPRDANASMLGTESLYSQSSFTIEGTKLRKRRQLKPIDKEKPENTVTVFLSVSPGLSVYLGEELIVSVEVSARDWTVLQYSISFGDQTPSASGSLSAPLLHFPHTYTSVGTFLLTADVSGGANDVHQQVEITVINYGIRSSSTTTTTTTTTTSTTTTATTTGYTLQPLNLADGMLPHDLKWSFTPQHAKVGDNVAIVYQVDTEVPPFNLTIHVNQSLVETLHFTAAPVFGLTVHTLNSSGRHDLLLRLTWDDQEANLTDSIWVLRPLTASHPQLVVPATVVTPPGEVTVSLTLSDSVELPTLVKVNASWGDLQALQTFDLSPDTQPGSKGNKSWELTHVYSEDGEFDVNFIVFNDISSVNLTRKVSVIPKLTLANVTVTQDGVSADTFTAGVLTVFTVTVKSGEVTDYNITIDGSSVVSVDPVISHTFPKAGVYEVTVGASGPGGTALLLPIEVKVARGISPDDVAFVLPQLVVTPPGETTLTLTLTGTSEVPTNVSGEVNWSDGTNTPIDLVRDTPPGRTEMVSTNLSHIYLSASTYQVTLRLVNPVSEVNLTQTLRVVNHITLDSIVVTYVNEADVPAMATDMFKTDVQINFTAIVKTGEATTFTLMVDNQSLTNDEASVFYTFTSAGNYTVSMSASGEAGVSAEVTTVVVVARPVRRSHMALMIPDRVVSPPGDASINISVTSSTELPTLVTGYLVWGDNEPETHFDLTQDTPQGAAGVVSRTLEHVYAASGSFQVTLVLINPVSQVNVTQTLRVLDKLTLDKIITSYANEADMPPWYTPVFKVNAPVNITALEDNGETTSFTLEVDGNTFTSSDPSFIYTFTAAGMYNISMTSSGEAGVSSAVATTVEVAREIDSSNLQLLLPDKVVWPPAETTVMVIVMAPGELPTHVEGTIQWGDEQDEDPMDLIEDTGPGALGAVSLNLTHNYSRPGDFLITLFMKNPVSLVNLSKEITVLDHLTLEKILVNYQDPSDAPAWSTDVFKTGVPLNFTAVMKTGDATGFTLKAEDQTVSQDSPFITYTFQAAGEYTVNMTCSGEAGVSPPAMKTVTLARPITSGQFDLILPNLVVWPKENAKIEVMVTDALELPTLVTGTIYWGDGGSESELDLSDVTPPGASGSVSMNMTHNYTQPGDYQVTISLRNSVSQSNLTKTLLVLDHLTLNGILVEYERADDEPKWRTDVFKAGAPLNLTALVSSGEAETFIFSVNNETIDNNAPSFVYVFPMAGEYVVSVRTKGTAGVSNAMTKTITVARALGEDNIDVLLPDFVVAPPGDTSITLTISSDLELPTNVEGTLTWGDGSQAAEVDLREYTIPGAQGQVVRVLNHTYDAPGVYLITWFLRNPVSERNITKTMTILQRIELGGLEVSYAAIPDNVVSPPGFFLLGEVLRIRPKDVKGDADRYVLKASGLEDIEQDSYVFNVTFDRESDYEITLQGYGVAGASIEASGWVRIRERVSDLALKVASTETRVNLELTFELVSPSLLGACLSLDTGDGRFVGWKPRSSCEGVADGGEEWQEALMKPSVKYTHEYAVAGRYTVTARLFSVMGEILRRINITVYESLPCDELSVWIRKNGTLDAPVNMTRADKLRVESIPIVNCSVPEIEMEITWRILRVNDSVEVSLTNIDTSKGVLFLPIRTLHYGLYRAIVSYNVSMTNPEGADVWAEMFGESIVNVGKSELMVVMVRGGAPRIRRGSLQTLHLRPGDVSYDPDYPEIRLTTYKWSCRKMGENWPQSDLTSDPPTTREDYQNEDDLGGCWGKGSSWMSSTESTMSIDVELFRHFYTVYEFQVIAGSADGRIRSATIEVEVVEGNPPTLVSGCSPPWFCIQIQGAQLVNPAKLILESRCEVQEGEEGGGEDGCGPVPLLYTWRVSGVPKDGDPVVLDIAGVTVGRTLRKFALLDDFWSRYSASYRIFDVQVTAVRSGESAEGLALQRIKINEAPRGGICRAQIVEGGMEEDEEMYEDEELEEIEGATKRIGGRVIPTMQVTALIDTVLGNCTGWEDPEGFEIPKYSFYGVTEKSEKMIFAFGPDTTTKIILPYINMTLWASVSDPMGAEAHYAIAIIEPLLPSKEAFTDYEERNVLVRAVGARNQGRVDMLLRAENSLKGQTLESEFGDEAPGDEENEDEAARKSEEKNQKMLGSIDKFTITSIDEVIQVNNILGAVADPLPKENQNSAVDALLILSGAVDKEAPLSQQKDFMAGALGTAANLMKGVNRNVNSNNTTGMDSQGNSQQNLRRRRDVSAVRNSTMENSTEGESDAEEGFTPSEDDKDANEKVEKMLDVVGASQGALLRSSVPGEEPSTIDAGDQVNMAVGFFDASELEGRVVTVGGAVYVFPSYCAIIRENEDCLTNKSITVGVQMAKWKGQVHGYGGGRDQLSDDSATMQLSLVDATSMPIPVNDSLEDFIMYIPRAADTVQEPVLVDPQISPKLGLSVHTVEVPAPRVGVTILVRPENDSNIEEWVLVWSSSKLNSTPEYVDNMISFTDLTYHEDTGFYELFLDSDTIGDVIGTYSVGFGMLNYTIPEPEEHPCFEDPPNNTVLESFAVSFDTNYSFSAFTSSCLFFNKELLTWSSDGCKVIGANLSVTICACNHLTSFASGFFVAPNTIDFAYVFANAGFADNLTIYLTLIISLSLYLIGLVYARVMDKKDVEKVGATPLADNTPTDRYLYNIMVHTGAFPSSGTESKVQFLLVGDWNETDVRTLNEGTERPLLTRGASDHFILATDRPLGPLQYLRIWHDNSGKGKKASWYFAYMVVRDIQTGEEFQFINNQWLAVEEGDGQIDRLIPVAGEQQLRDYSHVFAKTVERNMSDDHLWFSVVLKPARSRFTRVQRLSACMALLYLSMLANAMFYERVPDTPGGGGLNFGPFSLSPEAMGVGFISNLVVFPPSFIIVLFFRKSRPRKPKKSRLKEALAKQNPGVYGATLEAGKVPKSAFTPLSAARPVSSISATTQPTHMSSASEVRVKALDEDKKDDEDERVRRQGKKLRFPWWCVIIAWVLCVISIATAVFFLWAYGIQFGNEKATKWLTALITSIFSSALFTQPIKIYLTAMLLSWILKKPIDEHEDYDDDEEEVDLGSDEKYLHGPPSSERTRTRSQIQIGPAMSPEELSAARERREKELAMQELMFEIFIYLIFLYTILSVSYGGRDPNVFYMRNNIENIFVQTSSVTCPAFSNANVDTHFWCWTREVLVPNLLDTRLYTGNRRPQDMCGTITDHVTFLLGHAIFRQIRRKPGNPNHHPATHPNKEDDRDFGLGWNDTAPAEPHFDYRSALQIHGFPYEGILDKYGGGGYLIELKGPMRNAERIVDQMEEEEWIDKHTKAIFTEFAVYNPQVNLFAAVMFIFEFVPGGGLTTKFEFQGLTLLRYHTPGGFYVLVSEIGYILFTIFYTRREYKAFKKIGRRYFNSVWSILEVSVILLSYAAIVFYLLKTSLTYYTLDKFIETKGKKYIRIQPLAFLDSTTAYITSFQVFIGNIKLLKLLRFNKRIGMLSATLKYAAPDIIGFGLLFFITLVSFVTVFYLHTHTTVMEFSTFIKAAEASFFLINKKFDDITNAAPTIGPIFYFVFAFILYWIVFQLLIAIICQAFAKVSKDLTLQSNDYEIVEYIITRFSAYISAFRPNAVQAVHIPPPKPPDMDSVLRHLNSSLDRTLEALDRAIPPAGNTAGRKVPLKRARPRKRGNP